MDYPNFEYVGPQGYLPDVDEQIHQGCKVDDSLPYAILLGQVGDGEGGEFTADASGALSSRINDDDACLVDSAGELILDEPKLVVRQGSTEPYRYDATNPEYAPSRVMVGSCEP